MKTLGLAIYYALILGTMALFHLWHGWMLILMLSLASIPLAALNETAFEFMTNIIDFLIDLEIIEAIFGGSDND